MNAGDITLEYAELVAKQGITEELGTETCDVCGTNPRLAAQYPTLVGERDRARRDLKAVLAEQAWRKWEQQDFKDKWNEQIGWMQNKVKRQRQALARMYIEVQHLKAELKKERRKKCGTPTSSESLETGET